ncbi:NAD(P)H-dependent amine dehydrogenase family protein [Rhodococcus coprophilus]|uniref:Dihydrodipicolinate reductase n=1 Tax=Rhodococcus coprophilus TaxID=38310 RepID=A0A2X4U861_9NOCA|nr:dihydrodipicolinate reductase [Rhodococcus coprophilus]MBM7459208.1 4-hydroxy-tetrahydrodipicolinate reductase [Rhodococcus coprophilus]SQI35141.1 dihydrodipicolinate reductase [Rhodococcus coprophilus]
MEQPFRSVPVGTAVAPEGDGNRPLRVVQWATGNIGTRALRAVIDHPNLTLAGVYVHSDDKAGQEAGELCGRDPVGVRATRELDDILALDADCVLYMPLRFDLDEVCRILASGTHIVTTRGEFHHPRTMDPAIRTAVEEACALGRTSIHSTGSSPGFITEAVPLVLSSIQRRLDHLAIDEYADLSQRNSPGILFEIMGFGGPADTFEEFRLAHVQSNFGPSLSALADALGLSLDSIEASGEVALARNPVTIAAGTIDAGTVAAQRITVSGMKDGRELMRFRPTWYCTGDLDADWDLHSTGWHISVDGDAPLDIEMRFPVPLDRMSEVSPSYTANRAVNAIPAVCAAQPGIRTTVELPLIVPEFS